MAVAGSGVGTSLSLRVSVHASFVCDVETTKKIDTHTCVLPHALTCARMRDNNKYTVNKLKSSTICLSLIHIYIFHT